MRRHRFLLQLDIRKYFPSISHQKLLEGLTCRFPEATMTRLFRTIVEAHDGVYLRTAVQRHLADPLFQPERGRGLPIGLLTSQVWGNAFLDPLDQFIKRELKVAGYLRYMDDLTLFADSRAILRTWQQAIDVWIKAHLDLTLREERARLLPCTASVVYLGHRVDRQGHQPVAGFYRRLERRLHGWVVRMPPVAHVERSLASSAGLFRF